MYCQSDNVWPVLIIVAKNILPYVDILFINEFEAKMLTGIEIIDKQGNYSPANCSKAAQEILDMGVWKEACNWESG